MASLQDELDRTTGGASAGRPVEREVEHLGLWLVELLDRTPLTGDVDELVFELRTPTWGGRVDSCEVDVSARDAAGGRAAWEPGEATTSSSLLSHLARHAGGDVLERAAARLLAAALERLDPQGVLGGRSELRARVGSTSWTLVAG